MWFFFIVWLSSFFLALFSWFWWFCWVEMAAVYVMCFICNFFMLIERRMIYIPVIVRFLQLMEMTMCWLFGLINLLLIAPMLHSCKLVLVFPLHSIRFEGSFDVVVDLLAVLCMHVEFYFGMVLCWFWRFWKGEIYLLDGWICGWWLQLMDVNCWLLIVSWLGSVVFCGKADLLHC